MADVTTLELRPDLNRLKGAEGGAVAAGVGIALVNLALLIRTAGVLGLVLGLLAAAVPLACIGWFRWSLRNRFRLQLGWGSAPTDGELTLTPVVGAARTLRVSDVAEVLRVNYVRVQGPEQYDQLAVLVPRDSQAAVALPVKYWNDRQLVRLWQQMGLSLDAWETFPAPHIRHLLRQRPRLALPFRYAHATAFVLLWVFGIVLAVMSACVGMVFLLV